VRQQLGAHPKDLPFALIYLFDQDAQEAQLKCVHGAVAGDPIAPLVLELNAREAVWPARDLLDKSGLLFVEDLRQRFATVPANAWHEPAQQAVLAPLAQQGQERPAGFLIAGLNPYRPFDAEYRGFIDLLAGQVAAALSNARVYEEERK